MRIPDRWRALWSGTGRRARHAGSGQAVALPLRGQGELDVPDGLQDVHQGSVLLEADSSVRIVFIDAADRVPSSRAGGGWPTGVPPSWRCTL